MSDDFNNIGVAVIFGATVNYFSLNKDEARAYRSILMKADRVVLGATEEPEKSLAAFELVSLCGFLPADSLDSYISVQSTDPQDWVSAVADAAEYCREYESILAENAVDKLQNVRRVFSVVVL